MPRGRPDPFGQVSDGGRIHLVPDPQILEQDGPQLDEPQCRLATGDDGVHAGAVAVVWADAAVAIAVECRGIAAGPAVTLTGDQIDERRFLGLLHGLPLSGAGQGERGLGADESRGLWWPGTAGFWHSIRGQSPIAKRVIGLVATDSSPIPCRARQWHAAVPIGLVAGPSPEGNAVSAVDWHSGCQPMPAVRGTQTPG